jgi:competence protein ComEA
MVVDYLAVNFPSDKVNVNTATAQELQDALALTSAESDAIVQYRKTNGNFRDLTALRKVSGVDPKKIEAKKEQIEF